MDRILTNGIHAASGTGLLSGLTLAEVGDFALSNRMTEARLEELYLQSRRKRGTSARAPVEGVDVDDLKQAGWAVVFPRQAEPAIREALTPLLRLRQEQAGDRYRECSGDSGFITGESKREFLKRIGADATGPADPKRLPYYLLIVASPEEIPFDIQYELDVQYAVGRIHLGPTEAYARYADAVVAAESNRRSDPPRVAFVGVENEGDAPTRASVDHLVRPLMASFAAAHPAWQVEELLGEDAYKRDLLNLLQSPQAPSILFTASHGAAYDIDDSRQTAFQGALVMQDWEGSGPVADEQCFSAADIQAATNVEGMISLHFACFGAGTPDRNSFYGLGGSEPFSRRLPLAEKSFVAALPSRMLANGALASVGHVDMAFSASFAGGTSTASFDSMLKKLASGGRIGLAMDYSNLRHAELSVGLAAGIRDPENPQQREDFARRWLENNDARNYLLLGDPAVRLPLPRQPDRESVLRRIAELESELAALRALTV